MDRKYSQKRNKFKAFLKKNMYYIIMGLCITAIGAMVTVALLVDNNPTIDQPPTNTEQPTPPVEKPEPPIEPPVVADPMVFDLPVTSGKIIKDFTMDTVIFNQTLKHYAVHNGIDFSGNANSEVLAVYDGIVETVSYDPLNGHMVVIKHKDDVRTTYASLKDITVKAGESIKKGKPIGKISISATSEMNDGDHVHFSVTKAGAIVDPYEYLNIGDK